MKRTSITVLIVCGVILSACQPEPLDPMKVEILALDTDQQKQSYVMGASMGEIVQQKIATQQEVGINYELSLVAKGFIDALQGQSQLDKDQIQSISRAIETQVTEKQKERQQVKAQSNKIEGIEFLAANAKRAGIVVTESGLQYEVLKQGEGEKPEAFDTVKVHYRGTLLDGTEFDSSYSRNKPTSFPLNRVIKGWTEGVQLMNVGAKYKFYVPASLAYGARATGKVTGHSTLLFEIELLEIIKKKN